MTTRRRRSRLTTALAAVILFGSMPPAWPYSTPILGDGTVQPPPVIVDAANCLLGPSVSTCASSTWMQKCAAIWSVPTDPQDQTSPCWSFNQGSATDWELASYGSDPATTETVFDGPTQEFRDSLAPLTIGMPNVFTQASGGAWAAQENKAKFAAAQANIVNPLWYTRPTINSWAAGTPMKSCEDYVYRSFFTAERWIDAVNACKADDRCKVKVSLHGMTATGPSTTPGIARRVMADSEGKPVSDRVTELIAQGKIGSGAGDPFSQHYALSIVPKNDFYAQSYNLIVPSLIDAFKAQTGIDLQLLHNELWRGSTLYSVGGDAPVTGGKAFLGYDGKVQRGFLDEWDFHRFMLNHTAGVTDGQHREYRRRSTAVRQQWELLVDRMKCLHDLLPGGCSPLAPNAIGKLHPGETKMWQNDPIAARSLLQSLTPGQMLFPPSMTGYVGFGTNLQYTGKTLAEIEAAVQSGELLTGDQLASGLHLPGMYLPNLAATSLLKLAGDDSSLDALAPAPPDDPLAEEDEKRIVTYVAKVGKGALIQPLGPSVQGPAPHHDPLQFAGALSEAGILQRLWEVNPPIVDTRGPWPRLVCDRSVRTGGDGSSGGETRVDGGTSETPPLVTEPRTGLVVDVPFNTHKIWEDACELTNLMLDEWGRYLTQKPSCLDPKNLACDWQPRDFVDRFVTRNISYAAEAKEAEYRYCKRWTGGGDLTNTQDTTNVGVVEANRKDLPSFRTELRQQRELPFEQKFKTIPIKGEDDFGTSRTESETIGDGDFGGGFGYVLGWHAKAYERYDNPQDPARHEQICRMGGSAIAAFNAHAKLFGKKLDIIDAYASASANDGDTGQALGNAHLFVVGKKIFDTKDVDGADAQGTINLSNGFSDEAKDGGKPALLFVPFQVGWVTLTVTAGVSYNYGVRVNFNVGLPAPGCDPDNPAFSAKAKFAPFADLGVWVAADVSLAGLIGVGVEVDLTLVGLELPLTARVWLDTDQNDKLSLNFECTLDLVLRTLAGELSFYIELFWTKIASFTILKWDGFSHAFPIFRTPLVSLLLTQLPKGSVLPPGGQSCFGTDC